MNLRFSPSLYPASASASLDAVTGGIESRMFDNSGHGDGDVFRLCGSGNGCCGQRGQKHGPKLETHENLPCFGALLVGKTPFLQ